MKTLSLILIAIFVPFGSLIALAAFLRQRQERQRVDLVPRWRAFVEQPPANGEPFIAPAAVPALQPLKAEPERVSSSIARFQQRVGL